MPSIVSQGFVRLDFVSFYATEQDWDGWCVEKSVNGGPFTNIGDAAWVENGYTTTLNPSPNPLGGQRAFSGFTLTWTQHRTVVATSNGDTVAFRIRMGSDDSIGDDGVSIDNVNVLTTAAGLPCCKGANCDSSTAAPVLHVADFTCFLQKFAAQDARGIRCRKPLSQ